MEQVLNEIQKLTQAVNAEIDTARGGLRGFGVGFKYGRNNNDYFGQSGVNNYNRI